MTIAQTIANRWRQWHSHSAPEPAPARWVVLDTETSGLDPAQDLLLAIGGVAVDAQGIRLADSIEIVLYNDRAGSRDNIVVHGIGHGAQREGIPVAEALQELVGYVADAPCVGFHCAFDRAFLANAARQVGVALPSWPWLDVAMLAAAIDPQRYSDGCRDLDAWLDVAGVVMVARHNAAADALATAELLLHMRARAEPRTRFDHAALTRLAGQHRWLTRTN